MGRCEWDPQAEDLSYQDSGCPNQATLSVGTGENNIHLCESCASLPKFQRLRYRKTLPGPHLQAALKALMQESNSE